MRIISKGNKDYYDYLMGIYGQDELVIYDRRECFPIDPAKKWGCDIDRQTPIHCSDYQNINIERWFKKEVIYFDRPRKEIKIYSSRKADRIKAYRTSSAHRRSGIVETVLEGDVYHFALDVGYKRFIFEVERYIDDKDPNKLHLKYDMIRTYDLDMDKRICAAPMYLCPIDNRYYYGSFSEDEAFKINDEDRLKRIENPILYSTYIPKFITAEEMWSLLYEYISSLKNVEIIDTRTNEQHIESHGFDKRTSFRHRKR